MCVYKDNLLHCDKLFGANRVSLSVQEYMLKNKAEVALKILESNLNTFKIPEYIEEAIRWIKD